METIDLTFLDAAFKGITTTPYILIVANSPQKTEFLEHLLKASSQVLAADGAGDIVSQFSTNFRLIGDFDSVSQNTADIQGDTYKDNSESTTDVEKCITHAKQFFTWQIIVYNAFGGRMDHTLYNVFLAGKNPGVIFLNDQNVTLSIHGNTIIKPNVQATHFGYFPFKDCHVKTKGLVWDIDEQVSWDGLVSACNLKDNSKGEYIEFETLGNLFIIMSWQI
ncbi:thiamine pyrophosphokinase [Spironucleus salmonicida]|uniref:Thiamin pyrophosphokinase n=1 Tax=Spironucleus salmonicida TaxID=348837 RepID=V6M630_9EUKA|nr:thiamine pyrophosphokinase [Spironucleus salmonicida]|eukprot:EST48829.1 Thiamin pyrophosphokinase [Spironucleus salmonicida]